MNDATRGETKFELELDDLLHPADAFAHPQQVVNDPDLTLNEKRAVLASWASDACAEEAEPALRRAPGSERSVSFDDILEALCSLDRQARQLCPTPTRRWRRPPTGSCREYRGDRGRGSLTH